MAIIDYPAIYVHTYRYTYTYRHSLWFGSRDNHRRSHIGSHHQCWHIPRCCHIRDHFLYIHQCPRRTLHLTNSRLIENGLLLATMSICNKKWSEMKYTCPSVPTCSTSSVRGAYGWRRSTVTIISTVLTPQTSGACCKVDAWQLYCYNANCKSNI